MNAKEFSKLSPSAVIFTALKDLEECEQDSYFVINMGEWCVRGDSICTVCLAGAVIAKSLAGVHTSTTDRTFSTMGYGRSLTPSCYSLEIARRLLLLEEIRTANYNVLEGFNVPLWMIRHLFDEYSSSTDYEWNKTAFKKRLRGVADTLAIAGF